MDLKGMLTAALLQHLVYVVQQHTIVCAAMGRPDTVAMIESMQQYRFLSSELDQLDGEMKAVKQEIMRRAPERTLADPTIESLKDASGRAQQLRQEYWSQHAAPSELDDFGQTKEKWWSEK